MPDAPEQVSLYRMYKWEPFYQWACTIEQDADSPAGYRVVALDPHVADDRFLDRVEKHMRLPAEGPFYREDPDGTIFGGIETFEPGESGHFGAAAHSVPNASVGPAPKAG